MLLLLSVLVSDELSKFSNLVQLQIFPVIVSEKLHTWSSNLMTRYAIVCMFCHRTSAEFCGASINPTSD